MSFELDDRIQQLRSLGVQVVQVERLASGGSWFDRERILLLDRTREDWQQVSACDDALERQSVLRSDECPRQPARSPKSHPLDHVLTGAERAAEVTAAIAHCKTLLAAAGEDGLTRGAIKADLILFNPGATNDAITLLRIDPEITETRERRPANTGNGDRYRPWQVVLRLV